MDRINIMHSAANLKIYINELIHVAIGLEEFVAMRSHIQEVFNDPEYPTGKKWVITFFCKTAEIKCEYDTKEKWETILKLLDKYL